MYQKNFRNDDIQNFALIFSIFSLIFNFVFFWYKDELFARLFVFEIIPFGISFLLLLVSLVLSIIFIISHRSIIKNYIALAISIATIILILIFPFRMAKVNLELLLYEKDRHQIIEMVKNDELVSDDIGNVKLPKGFGKLSTDGNIFVHQNDEEQVVSFWVYRGMLSGSVQLVYSSQDEGLIYANQTGHPITNITELKEHWYLVETDY